MEGRPPVRSFILSLAAFGPRPGSGCRQPFYAGALGTAPSAEGPCGWSWGQWMRVPGGLGAAHLLPPTTPALCSTAPHPGCRLALSDFKILAGLVGAWCYLTVFSMANPVYIFPGHLNFHFWEVTCLGALPTFPLGCVLLIDL